MKKNNDRENFKPEEMKDEIVHSDTDDEDDLPLSHIIKKIRKQETGSD